jgi:hypothetical protein
MVPRVFPLESVRVEEKAFDAHQHAYRPASRRETAAQAGSEGIIMEPVFRAMMAAAAGLTVLVLLAGPALRAQELPAEEPLVTGANWTANDNKAVKQIVCGGSVTAAKRAGRFTCRSNPPRL